MLQPLKSKLQNNNTPQLILSQLTNPAFINSLTLINLQELIKIVEGKLNNYKLHYKIIIAIYTIIIMKSCKNYNTKLAIDNLCRIYKQLLNHNQDKDKKNKDNNKNQQIIHNQQQQLTIPNKTRQVIANLLIRIPTFSNYKLIIKDIKPQLIPLSIIQQHKINIIKQCPNLYKQHIIKQYKYIWYQLIQNDQQNYPLGNDLAQINKKMREIIEKDKVMEGEIIYMEIQKNLGYVRNRIIYVEKQELDIEKICKQFDQILTYIPATNFHKKILFPQLINKQNNQIRKIKTSCLQLLRLLIIKLKYNLFRKYTWLTSLIYSLITRSYDQYSIQPSYLIALCTTMLEQFGLGFYNFDQFVHSNDGPYSLSLLISALCYNDYRMNNKQQENLVNYQAPKNRNKKNNTIRINLYNSSVVDSAYQFYLKTTNVYERQVLLDKILHFLKRFYLSKNQAAMQPFHSSQIFGVLGTSKNQISQKNKQLISQIKQKILFRNYTKIGDHFEQFCDDVFNTYIKKRKQKKFQILRSLQVQIQPQINKNKLIEESSKSLLQMRQNNSNDQNQLKKTHSFDFHLQGWNTEKSQKKDQEKGDKSEMFYSIKESSIGEEVDQAKKYKQGEQQQEEREFILTPSF